MLLRNMSFEELPEMKREWTQIIAPMASIQPRSVIVVVTMSALLFADSARCGLGSSTDALPIVLVVYRVASASIYSSTGSRAEIGAPAAPKCEYCCCIELYAIIV